MFFIFLPHILKYGRNGRKITHWYGRVSFSFSQTNVANFNTNKKIELRGIRKTVFDFRDS